MKFTRVVIKVIEILGSVWFISPAVLAKVKLNLTGRPATQSSNYNDPSNGGLAIASRAIDGNYSTNMYAWSCSHTDDPSGGISWWRVDLGQPVKVQQIIITNRNGYGNRLDNFVVGLSNSSANPVRGYYALCGQYPGPAANGANLTLQCNPGTASGRYVIVQQSSSGNGLLTICEIEIYAGQVRRLERWQRLSNKRVMSVDAIVQSARSPMICVGKCQPTVGCDSVNYHQLDNKCEMNFLPPGANGSHMVIEDGWDNWVQMYEFI